METAEQSFIESLDPSVAELLLKEVFAYGESQFRKGMEHGVKEEVPLASAIAFRRKGQINGYEPVSLSGEALEKRGIRQVGLPLLQALDGLCHKDDATPI